MAEKRIRDNDVTPGVNDEVIKTPEQKIEQPNQFESILQKIEQLEQANKEKDTAIANLTKQVAEAKGDISEQVKESKRKYGFNVDGSRREDEHFKFRYNCLINESVEKVVISTETIGRPVNVRNENTGKWTNIHNVKVTFHDGTSTEIDVLDYINQKFQYEEFVPDADIKKDAKGVKTYTFKTEKFGTFTVSEKFINN